MHRPWDSHDHGPRVFFLFLFGLGWRVGRRRSARRDFTLRSPRKGAGGGETLSHVARLRVSPGHRGQADNDVVEGSSCYIVDLARPSGWHAPGKKVGGAMPHVAWVARPWATTLEASQILFKAPSKHQKFDVQSCIPARVGSREVIFKSSSSDPRDTRHMTCMVALCSSGHAKLLDCVRPSGGLLKAANAGA